MKIVVHFQRRISRLRQRSPTAHRDGEDLAEAKVSLRQRGRGDAYPLRSPDDRRLASVSQCGLSYPIWPSFKGHLLL